MGEIPADVWLRLLRQLTYISDKEERKLRLMTGEQLAMIEELIHRALVTASNRLPSRA